MKIDCYQAYINYDSIIVPAYFINKGGIENALSTGNFYELVKHEFLLMERFFKPRDVVYDLGAYIGTHSIFCALKGAEVYAFEPARSNYPFLIKNCEPFKQIHCFNVALNDKEYSCITHFKDCASGERGVNFEQPITYVNLLNFIEKNNLPLPNFIKMDIEGMETIVLKTIIPLFKKARPTILCEFHKKGNKEDNLEDYKDNPNWRFIEEGGFDFNQLKDIDYKLISVQDEIEKDLDNNLDWNKEIQSAGILIPKEKYY